MEIEEVMVVRVEETTQEVQAGIAMMMKIMKKKMMMIMKMATGAEVETGEVMIARMEETAQEIQGGIAVMKKIMMTRIMTKRMMTEEEGVQVVLTAVHAEVLAQ
jgi:hypothetical protein